MFTDATKSQLKSNPLGTIIMQEHSSYQSINQKAKTARKKMTLVVILETKQKNIMKAAFMCGTRRFLKHNERVIMLIGVIC